MTEVGSAFTYTYSLVDNIASYADMHNNYTLVKYSVTVLVIV